MNANDIKKGDFVTPRTALCHEMTFRRGGGIIVRGTKLRVVATGGRRGLGQVSAVVEPLDEHEGPVRVNTYASELLPYETANAGAVRTVGTPRADSTHQPFVGSQNGGAS